MKFNWFALAVIILFLGAMIQEAFHHNWKLSSFYFLSAAINAVVAYT
jgi:hypothetical protein